jgi:hypothetical protein
MPTGARVALWCLAVSCRFHAGEAAYREFEVDGMKDALLFLEQDVGLEPGARISLDITNHRPVDNLFVFLITIEQYFEWNWEEAMQVQFPGSSGSSDSMSGYLTNSWRRRLDPLQTRLETSFELRGRGKARYFLCLMNPERQELSLNGSIHYVNPGGNQLPLQQQHVPPVLFWTAWLFFFSAAAYTAWLQLAWTWGFWQASAKHLLVLLGSCVLVKGTVLMLWWADYQHVEASGKNSPLFSVLWQVFDKVYDILELMMFLLIALGWKIIRNNLSFTEKRFAIFVSVVSLLLGWSQVACTTSARCSGYELSRYLLHSFVYLIVICAMNLNLQRVNSQIQEGPASVESGKLYQKWEAYKGFRWIFLVFIVAPSAEISIKVWFAPWEAAWLYVLILQLRCWGILVGIILHFALLSDAPPLRIFKDLTRDIENENEA